MNKTNDSRLNMFDAIVAYCNNNTDTVASVPAFETAFTDFETIVGQIHDIVKMQATVISGITADKQQLRIALCQQAANLGAIASAFATSTNNNELNDQVSFSFSDLKRLSGEMLVPTCSNMFDAMNANSKVLKTYGISADSLTAFQTAMDDYEEKIASPRNAVSQRAAHRGTLTNLFQQANGILKGQMDKMAIQFEISDNDFYAAYKHNRTIVNTATAATQITGTVSNSVTHSPLPGATVQVVGQPIITVTNENGFFVLKSVSPGSRSIKANIAGYGDKQQDDLLVKSGKTTDANIALAPNA